MSTSSLTAKNSELLALFPRKMDKLRVVTPENSLFELYAIYYQKDTDDPFRSWDPQDSQNNDFEHLYITNRSFMISGLIPENSKLILSVRLSKINNKVARLGNIRRNMDKNLRGLGEEYYDRMINWLDSKGFSHLILTPAHGLEKYWKNRGQTPIGGLSGDTTSPERYYESTYVQDLRIPKQQEA